ncbi:extracellular solute-binding protein [Alicyclobacillus sp. SO9]|uniref:extracellular solute-binding protein n=1 Tax=Alicyclobacillus sp. SO9 TaxID=2665646 RepID=UPI0018E734A8|nr:extracellular solute-binding protein [Alicyclobacillus sp. SO9]QQE77954.1 extracellular solute-binding protein [Alicyclobacillus sp. SO9]
MKLRFAGRKFDSFEKALSIQVKRFTSLYPDWDVDLDFYEVEDLYRVIREGKNNYDVVMCSTDWLPEFIQKSKLAALDPFFEVAPIDGWPDDWTNSLKAPQLGPDGKCYGIAYHDGPVMFYYRKDLFEDPKEQHIFEQRFGMPLAVPNTWEEFIRVARHFTRPEQGLFGTVIGGYPDGHNNVFDFLLQLWSRGGSLFDADRRPVFNSDKGIQALQFLVDLIHVHKVVPPEVFDLDSIRAGEYYYSAGRAAMTWNWSHIAACAELPELSSIVGKNSWTVIPIGEGSEGRRTSVISYYINGILQTSKHPDMAYRLMKVLSSKDMDKITTFEGGIGTRLSTWRDPQVLHRFPFFSMIERIHGHARSTPQMIEYPQINQILNQAVDAALHLRGEVGQLLDEAVEETQSLL